MSGTSFIQQSPKKTIALLLSTQLGLAASAGAAQNVTVSWDHSASTKPVSAYQLYQDNILLCETLDPAAREITCPTANEGNSVFSIAAVYSDGDPIIPPANAAPVAEDLSITLEEDGSINSLLNASDPENDALNYVIVSQPASGALILTDPLTGAYVYTASTDVSGADSFTYMVNDGNADSNLATVNITITPVNDSPLAEAGTDQSVPEGQTIVLDATGSRDIEASLVSYSWQQVSGPATEISDNSVAQPTIMTPDVGAEGAVLTYELTVTDSEGLQAQDTVSITIEWVNMAPIADAGTDMSVSAGSTVTLNGSASSDGDDGIATYNWVQTSGTLVTLSDSNTMQPTFTAAADIQETQNLNFALTVTDHAGVQHTDSSVVEVIPNPSKPIKNVTIAWTAPTTAELVSSYRILHNGTTLCETLDGTAREITCPITLAEAKNEFSITALYSSSTETAAAATNTATVTATTEQTVRRATATGSVTTESDSAVSTSVPTEPADNQTPFASAFEIAVEEDGTIYDSLTGIDADGDVLTYTIVTEPSFGLVELLNINTGEFRYLTDRDMIGVDSFTYEVSDGQSVSESAAVTITITPNNDAPVANAGPDQVVSQGAVVMLDSTNSYDVDDEFLTVLWTQMDGPEVILSDALSIQPQFETSQIDVSSATLTFQLTVTDAQGFESKDVSTVNVVLVNEPPKADAGVDQTVFEGDAVVLDASESNDSDDSIASYSWVQVSGAEMVLSDPTAMQPGFTAPNVGEEGASMTFEMTATDLGGLYTTDTVVINTSRVNAPPIADAGVDQIVSAGDVVTLDGLLSNDEDDGIASIQWLQKTGIPVTLDYPTVLQPTFEAVAGLNETVNLTFELVITDYSGLKHTDSITVSVQPLQM